MGLKNEIATFGIGLIAIPVFVMSCANKGAEDYQGNNPMTAKTIKEVLKQYTKELMTVSGVVGTAQGCYNGKPCIKVYVIEKTSELEQNIPDILEGYSVVIEETGEIKALPENQP